MRLALPIAATVLLATACAPREGGGTLPTPTPQNVSVDTDALSPFAIEVRWTTTTDTTSPVAFSAGSGETTVVANADAPVSDHRVLLQMLDAGATYDIRVGDDTGFTGTASETTPAAAGGPFQVLFDASSGEDAGNADWLLDDQSQMPTPSNPSSATAWSGAYSSFGYALHDSGRYAVESLPDSAGTFTYGSGAQDLAGYCAVILPEPNNTIPPAGLAALKSYVNAGGGVLLIADHDGSDRDSDGIDSILALNDLSDLDPAWGWSLDAQNLYEPACTNVVQDSREPLLHGPFGEVASVGFYNATTARIVPAQNPRMRPILWRPNQHGNAGLFIAAGFYGAGKIVIIGDSSPADDGTGNPGNSSLVDSWNDTSEDNAAFFLNATAWLCDDIGG